VAEATISKLDGLEGKSFEIKSDIPSNTVHATKKRGDTAGTGGMAFRTDLYLNAMHQVIM
jgi:hypothetical protein